MTDQNTRVKRTGDLKHVLFPEWCLFCKKSSKLYVDYVRYIELLSAEQIIRHPAALKDDHEMLTAIQSAESLLASEFKTHAKCYKDYTQNLPPEKKRCREEDYIEILAKDGTSRGRYLMRNRPLSNDLEKLDNDAIGYL